MGSRFQRPKLPSFTFSIVTGQIAALIAMLVLLVMIIG